MREFAGATGRLWLDPDGRVHRRLAWARFERGEPVAMREPGEAGLPEERDVPEDARPRDTGAPP